MRKTSEIHNRRPRIFKIFEITSTIYSNSERSEQFVLTECFFNLFLDGKIFISIWFKFLFNPLQYFFGRHNEIKKEKKFGIFLVLKSRVTLIHHLKVHKSWLTHNYNRMHLELNKTEIGTPVAPNLSCICWSIKTCAKNLKSWVPTVL